MEISKLAEKLGISRKDASRAARAERLETFTRMLAHKPMRKAMPQEPKAGASIAENQRYEDAMDVHVMWRQQFDAYAAGYQTSRGYAYRSETRASRKAMALNRWKGNRSKRRRMSRRSQSDVESAIARARRAS